MRFDDVDIVTVRLLSGRLVIHVDPEATAVEVSVETGPFTARSGAGVLDIFPQGYDPCARTSAGSGSIQAGGDVTIIARNGGVAAGVIHGSIHVGPGGVEIGPVPDVGPTDGSIIITAPPRVTFRLHDCHGMRTGPDEEQHEMDGDDRFKTAAPAARESEVPRRSGGTWAVGVFEVEPPSGFYPA